MAPKTIHRRKAALLCILAASKVIKDSAQLRKRRVWVKNWLQHKERGSYWQICRELEQSEPLDFKMYLRMSPDMFRLLLTKVGPIISKDNTNMREAVAAGARLEATLQFLASGCSYTCLQYSTRIGRSTLSSIIPETCAAILQSLRDDYVKVGLSVYRVSHTCTSEGTCYSKSKIINTHFHMKA